MLHDIDRLCNWAVTRKKSGKTHFTSLQASFNDDGNRFSLTKLITIANGKVISDTNRVCTIHTGITRNLRTYNVGVNYENYSYKVFDINGNELYNGMSEPTDEDIFYYTMSSGAYIYPTGRHLDFTGITIEGEQFVYDTWEQKQ